MKVMYLYFIFLIMLTDPSSPLIGPSGTWKDGSYVLTGNAGMATHAEILGDIDGFNIGKRIMAEAWKPLSQHLQEYYIGESAKRFDIFKSHTTKSELQSEVYKFANLYETKDASLVSTFVRNSFTELAIQRAKEIELASQSAVTAFCTRYASELAGWCK